MFLKKRLLAFGLIAIVGLCCQAQRRVAPIFFWNVENFFDCQDDTLTLDDEFTPQGDRHWTPKRYAIKRDMLAKTIIAMGEVGDGEVPVAVGLCEVENDQVLRDLCLGTPLRNLGYDFVHYDSKERRGVDCALLYRKDRLRILRSEAIFVGDTVVGFLTRDLLKVEALLDGQDTLTIFVCHLPSKLGGETAELRRNNICARLRDSILSAEQQHPEGFVIAMGDMNSEAGELDFIGSDTAGSLGFVNLTVTPRKRGGEVMAGRNVLPQNTGVRGSYFYQGYWSTIDQILVSEKLAEGRRLWPNRRLHIQGGFFVFAPSWLLEEAPNQLSVKPFRTYLGPKYHGGVSDHLPVGIICVR